MAFPKENACDQFKFNLIVTTAPVDWGSVMHTIIKVLSLVNVSHFLECASKALEAENVLIYTTAGPRGE